jgi:hypothetical protein
MELAKQLIICEIQDAVMFGSKVNYQGLRTFEDTPTQS